MANQIDALINVKDASGVLNEIYPITKKENVQGLAELVNSCLSKSGGTMTGALTLKGEPTADSQAATKKYVDDKAPLILKATDISTTSEVNAALKLIGLGRSIQREVLLIAANSIYHLCYASATMAIFICTSKSAIKIAYFEKDNGGVSYDEHSISATQRTVTLSSTGWTASGSVYTQTATVSDVSATETEQEIHVTPSTASMSAYMEAGVYASAQATNQITFTASKVPTANLTVYALIKTL